MRSALFALLMLAGLAHADEGRWPGFRGEGARGIADTDVFSRIGDSALNLDVVWKQPIGSGYSGIAVSDGLAITLCADGERDVAVAFDAATGEERWRRDVGPTYAGHDGSFDGPLTTPVIFQDSVVTLGPHGHLAGRALATGEVRWQRDLVADGVPKPDYGFASSPMVVAGVLLVQPGPGNSLVSGYDVATGERLWSAGSDQTEYQSPSASDGRVWVAGVSKLIAVDPRDGSIEWHYAHNGEGAHGAFSIVPVPVGSKEVLISHRQDVSALVNAVTGQQWASGTLRKSYNVPVYADGRLFGYSGFLLTCTDTATGELVWRSRAPGDGFLIAADGHLVIITKRGRLHVARTSASGYEERAALDVLKPPVWTIPGLAGDRIFLRGMRELACVAIRGSQRRNATPVVSNTEPQESGSTGMDEPKGDRGEWSFEQFLAEVAAADDKAGEVDRFLADDRELPLVEGSNTVHFLFRGEATDMAIEGDMLGARQQAPMHRVEGTDLFYFTTQLDPAARVNYLFVKDYVEIKDPANARSTITSLFGAEMEVSLGPSTMEMSWMAMPAWQAPAHLEEPERQGRLALRRIPSRRLKREIRVDVYLPQGYVEGASYPVLFVHGRKDVLARGHWVQSLDNLVGTDVEPLVVVFIDQAGMTTDHEAYAAMVVHELIPAFPADQYGHVGMGVGCYLAAYTALRHPGHGTKLGLQSMFMLDTMEQRMDSLLSGDLPQMEVYLEWGQYDLRSPDEAWDMREVNQRMWDRFEANRFILHGGRVPDGTGWSSWKNRTDLLLKSLFGISDSESEISH